VKFVKKVETNLDGWDQNLNKKITWNWELLLDLF
jgi:hypothetical protein